MTHRPSLTRMAGSAVSVSVIWALTVNVPRAPSKSSVKWLTRKVGAPAALTNRLRVVNVPLSDIAPEVEKVPGTGPGGFEAAIVTLSGGEACATGTRKNARTKKPRVNATRSLR